MTNVATRFQPDISGSAVPAGFIGERFVQTLGSDISGIGTTATSILSQSLTAGVWLVTASTGFTSGTNNVAFTSLYQGTTASLIGPSCPSYTASQRGHSCVSWVVNLSSTTTIGVCGNSDTGTINAGSGRNSLVCVRIA